jgi:hypothetical protein
MYKPPVAQPKIDRAEINPAFKMPEKKKKGTHL